MRAERIDEGLYRVRIPFEDLNTTVYFVLSKRGLAVIDSGACPEDVDRFLLPALRELGLGVGDVRLLLLTHWHGDHAGGFARLCACFPQADAMAPSARESFPAVRTVRDGTLLLGALEAVALPGHTADSMGYWHLPSGTLLSGDCLQLEGVGAYKSGIALQEAYLASLSRLEQRTPLRILAAHEYEPLGSLAEGEAAVRAYLSACRAVARRDCPQ